MTVKLLAAKRSRQLYTTKKAREKGFNLIQFSSVYNCLQTGRNALKKTFSTDIALKLLVTKTATIGDGADVHSISTFLHWHSFNSHKGKQ